MTVRPTQNPPSGGSTPGQRKRRAAADPVDRDWPVLRRTDGPHFTEIVVAALPPGFTLVELMVAIAVMALMALLSWRGLDGMSRAQTQTQARSDEILVLQAGLAQWKADLDAMADGPQITSLDWDGRVLQSPAAAAGAADGLRVVAWTRRTGAGSSWLRWQSPPMTTLDDWRAYWGRLRSGPRTRGRRKKREVAVFPLDEWQIFYFRGGAWSNPLSSDGTTAAGQSQPFRTAFDSCSRSRQPNRSAASPAWTGCGQPSEAASHEGAARRPPAGGHADRDAGSDGRHSPVAAMAQCRGGSGRAGRVQSAWLLTGALDWARLILRQDAITGGADHLAEPWAVPLNEARLSTFLSMETSSADSDRDAFLPGRSPTCRDG